MKYLSLIFIALALLLGACSRESAPKSGDARPGFEPREDSQGSVTVQVTPLNVDAAAAEWEFEVTLETHVVDLSMDLARLSYLSNDRGDQVQAIAWPMGSGHHYTGILRFPAAVEGKPLMQGARELVLTIRDLDAAERRFTWRVPSS